MQRPRSLKSVGPDASRNEAGEIVSPHPFAAIIPHRRKVTRRVTAYGSARRNAHARAHCHRRLCIMPFRGDDDDDEDDEDNGGGGKECASIGRRA